MSHLQAGNISRIPKYLEHSAGTRYKWVNSHQKAHTPCSLGVVSALISSVQLLSRVQLFSTTWTAARQASLSITNSRSLLKLMSIESVMPSNHLILCCPLLLPPSIFPSNRVFSNELVFHTRWPKYWSFSFSISPSNEYSGLTSCRMNGQRSLFRSPRTGVHSPSSL